jgi:integrase
LFPGTLPGQPLSGSPFRDLMKRLDAGATIHGWRSSARTWAAEQTDHADGVCDAALAHKMKDRTAAAYNRGPLLEKRRRLMDHWARYLAGETAAKGLHLRRRRVMLRRRPMLRLAA